MFRFFLLLFLAPLCGFAVLAPSFILPLSPATGNTVPQIAVNATADAISVWATNFSNQVQGAVYTRATNSWTPPFVLGSGSAPDVGIDQNGNGIAVWVLSGQIVASFFSRAQFAWFGPVLISPTGVNISPRVAMSSSGNAIALWLNNFPAQIQVAAFNITTLTWDPAIQISTQPAAFPEISVDSQGNGIAVWQNLNNGIIESRFLLRVP